MVRVIVPWRAAPSREVAFDFVADWYRCNLDDVQIVTVDSDEELFNLARARNLGMAEVGDPHEVVVITDADTFPEPGALREAIADAATSGLVHLPYSSYHWLGARGTAQLVTGTPVGECDFELVRGACSGVYVTTAATWWAHGGQDERFRGWGFEDAAWYLAHETLLGAPPQRHPGSVFAMHHDTQLRAGEQYERNAALAARYRAVTGKVSAMVQLIEEASAENARSLPDAV